MCCRGERFANLEQERPRHKKEWRNDGESQADP